MFHIAHICGDFRCKEGVPLPFPCAFMAAAVNEGTIWFCGGLSPDGNGKLRSVSSIYVFSDGSWSFYDVLALNRHALQAITYSKWVVTCLRCRDLHIFNFY